MRRGPGTGRTTLNSVAAVGLATVLAALPAGGARADSAGAAAVSGAIGFALGTILGGAMNGGNQQPQQPRRTAPSKRSSQPAQQKPKPVVRAPDKKLLNAQTALKYVGLYTGSVDGQNGPGTRRAVAAFQDALGEPQTGTLTDTQYDVLMKFYADRSNSGSAVVQRDQDTDQLFAAISRAPVGNTPAGPSVAPAGAATAVAVATIGAAANAGVQPAASAAVPAIGAGQSSADKGRGYSDLCLGRVAVKKPDATPDEAVLRAHFCATQAHALAAGQAAMVAADVTDMSFVKDQCTSAGDGVLNTLADAAGEAPAERIARLGSAQAMSAPDAKETMARSFAICVGYGIGAGQPRLVKAAAFALAALGREAYLELPAAALALGIGEAPAPGEAAVWYAYLAGRPTVAGPAADELVITAADSAAFATLAAALKSETEVQTARSEGFFVPQFSRPASAGSAAVSPAAPAAPTVPPTAPAPSGAPRAVLSNAAIAERLKDAIVVIYDPKSMSSGTGFLIGPGYILTNSHVVDEASRVVVASRRYGVRAANVVARGLTNRQVGIDAAVLETVNWTGDRHLRFHPVVREGERVAIGGFPGRASAFDRSSERFFDIISAARVPATDDIPVPKFDFGHVQSIIINNATGLRNIQEGLETSPGNSGSPIANECGDVVGLHYQGSVAELKVSGGTARGDTSKYNYAITSDEVIKFLQSLNIPHEVESDHCI